MRVLYLSYDGMTDPLGSSQVIPYLRGLAALKHRITIVSAEKPQRFERDGAQIRALLESLGIAWSPLVYHKRPPMLSTVWDVSHMGRRAFELARSQDIELVHCRSYVPSLVGLRLKRKLGIRFLFDMRGFWADERVDGGLWDLRKPHYQIAYQYFKQKERSFLNESDGAISLTHAGKQEMAKWDLSPGAQERIEVIPCCADLDFFDRTVVDPVLKEKFRLQLGLDAGDFVVSYLGSVGTWYLLEEMLDFFAKLQQSRPRSKFLFITPDDPRRILEAAARRGVAEQHLRVIEASRADVPALLSLSNLGLFFIKPSYSKISSSPTKLAELLAMGIPVVTNARVGDSDRIAERFHVGDIVKEFTEAEFSRVIEGLPKLLAIPSAEIRAAAESYFSLDQGVAAYQRIYTSLSKGLD